MPQFDPTMFQPQLIWLAISFAVLYALMAGVALPRIARVLEERQDRIDDNLQRAGELQADAEAAAEAYEETLAEARARAHRVLLEAGQRLSLEAAGRQTELSHQLAADIEAAEARIAKARDEAVANIRDAATGAARQAAEVLSDEPVEEKAAAAAIDAALEDRG